MPADEAHAASQYTVSHTASRQGSALATINEVLEQKDGSLSPIETAHAAHAQGTLAASDTATALTETARAAHVEANDNEASQTEDDPSLWSESAIVAHLERQFFADE